MKKKTEEEISMKKKKDPITVVMERKLVEASQNLVGCRFDRRTDLRVSEGARCFEHEQYHEHCHSDIASMKACTNSIDR